MADYEFLMHFSLELLNLPKEFELPTLVFSSQISQSWTRVLDVCPFHDFSHT